VKSLDHGALIVSFRGLNVHLRSYHVNDYGSAADGLAIAFAGRGFRTFACSGGATLSFNGLHPRTRARYLCQGSPLLREAT